MAPTNLITLTLPEQRVLSIMLRWKTDILYAGEKAGLSREDIHRFSNKMQLVYAQLPPLLSDEVSEEISEQRPPARSRIEVEFVEIPSGESSSQLFSAAVMRDDPG